MRRSTLFFTILFSILSISSAYSQTASNRTKANQLGFYPNQHKYAVTPVEDATAFYVKDTESGVIVYIGTLTSTGYSITSNEQMKLADFSDFNQHGRFTAGVFGAGASFPFEIKNNVYSNLNNALIKALYYNRASVPLLAEHAGKWSRNAGHPDINVQIHPSAASEGRPAGSTISSPGGWYDAGDFNKYVVPISSSISHMLTAFENFPEFFTGRDLNIPESGDNVPDVLDEARFALDWLLTMQDPFDGGVYHKLTHSNFQGTVMPQAATATRYVVQKSTTAALDFAAVMAQASRVFAAFDQNFADTALVAATRAYQWAVANPNIAYDQNAMNASFNPDISTGEYGGGNFSDEFFWAEAELYITTGNNDYYPDNGWNNVSNGGWGNVQSLGLFSLLNHRQNLTAPGLADTTAMKNALVNGFEWAVNAGQTAPYRSPFGNQNWMFNWGSNGGAGNFGMAFMIAYQVTGQDKYYRAAIDVMDYLLGRNGVAYSYVTGFGEQSAMRIHHRQSEADGIIDPVPGWVAGGANPYNQSQDCGAGAYSSTLPMLSYLDEYCSYSTNEITTYWNSPFIYLTAGLEAFSTPVEAPAPNPIRFNGPDENLLYFDNDTLQLSWESDGITSADLYYKVLPNGEFMLVESGFTANDTTYAQFIIPELPGDSLLFKLQDSQNPSIFGYSSIVRIVPVRTIDFISVETTNGGEFLPDTRLSIQWSTTIVEAVNLSYRLSSQFEYTLIRAGLGSSGNYIGFKIPDALGDSLFIRVSDANDSTLFLESDPIKIGTATSTETEADLATQIRLHQNYPNPFNPSTVISYQLMVNSNVRLAVYDALGRQISMLVDGRQPAGEHQVRWNAGTLAGGVYYYRLELDGQSLTRKMMLIK